ncbi:MAG TPA: sigma-70 family RNA polymerase sigma factor [Candidatus Polarisedimenticolia bacterium]|jgi:RNA polymerase sigma-70 factor (ECF subfamily)
MEPDDAQIVARARGGDDEAFRALVERHSRALFRLAWRITGNEQDAEDVVQESYMKAYRSLGSFESRANFGTWLHKITANCALDLARSRQRRRELNLAADGDDDAPDPLEQVASGGPSPDRVLHQEDVGRRVNAALGLLSAQERAAFVLRHFEERSIDEIGRTLGLRENATKQSIFRAVRKLRRALEPLAAPARSE